MVQVQDAAARFFTVFEIAANGGSFKADILEPPERIEPGVVVPTLEHVAACYIECRWERWFVDLVGRVAKELRRPSWVLDTHGALWAADRIDGPWDPDRREARLLSPAALRALRSFVANGGCSFG